jgi:cardiolipin synthase
MRYRLYTTSDRAWDAMLSAIETAKKYIYMEMYIFSSDTGQSHDFIGKLKQKARQGLKVVIVADAYGSQDLKKEVEKNLKDSGIEFLFFSHWLRHIHRKILVIDEKTAFVGGVNIGKEFRYWNDLELELTGRTVKRIIKSFAYTYAMAGGKNHRILNYRQRKFVSKLRFWLLEHMPSRNIHTLKSHYAEKITSAQKSIQVVTPYFTPPRWLISLLDDALRRGVRVEIIIPKNSLPKIASRINYRFMHILHPSGVKFYLTKNMNHAKMLLIDGEEGLIGSQNFDALSFRLNHEVGIFFREKNAIRELSRIVEEWKRNSTGFEPKKYQLGLVDYIIFALIKILHPIL